MVVKFTDHILVAGNHAALPAAATTPWGALYSCTDHSKIYRNNGTTWDDWSEGGGLQSPDDAPAAANALDDEFDVDGAIDAKWNWVNQGGATAVNSRGRCVMTAPATGAGGSDWKIIQQAIGAGDFSVTARLALGHLPTTALLGGLVVGDSTGQLVVLHLGIPASVTGHYQIYKAKQVNPTTFTSSALLLDTQPPALWLRISRVGANLLFYVSYDGLTWILLATESETAFLAVGVSDVGLTVCGQHATNTAVMSIDYFRVA